MSNFEKEFEQRLRRLCGITDDTKRVRYDEDLDPGFQSCTCDGGYGSYDYGARYSISITVYEEKGTYQTLGIAERQFDDMGDFIRAVMAVEL